MAYYLITYSVPGFGPFGVSINEFFNEVTDMDPIDWLWDKNIINRKKLGEDGKPLLDKKGREIIEHNSKTHILINYKKITEDQFNKFKNNQKESGYFGKYYKITL